MDKSMEAQFQAAQVAGEFIFAGNAYFTLRSVKTGTRYTYRVNQPDDKKKDGKFFYFVSLLAGPDNNNDYQYMGIITKQGFRLTKASKFKQDSLPVKAIQFALDALKQGKIPALLEIWHEGRCGRCGRRLTVPESIATGFGPECAERVGAVTKPLTPNRDLFVDWKLEEAQQKADRQDTALAAKAKAERDGEWYAAEQERRRDDAEYEAGKTDAELFSADKKMFGEELAEKWAMERELGRYNRGEDD